MYRYHVDKRSRCGVDVMGLVLREERTHKIDAGC